jgi:adenylate cyclase
MNRTAGVTRRTNNLRSASKQATPLAVLRKWRRSAQLRRIVGETHTLSFLVCRIRGFDELTASYAADPESLCRLVRRAATLMADAVHAHGGTLDRVFAGGFSAYFDEPDVHTQRACECALAMLMASEGLGPKLPDGSPLRIGIGLDTGSAILGDFGTEDQPYYAAVGRTAQRADALEHLSQTYGAVILAGHAVERGVEHSFPFLQVDHYVEGDGDAQPVWAMLLPPLSRSNPKFLALKSFHARIFESLRAQNWDEARNLVEQCRVLSAANSVLYDFYLRRIADYQANPPRPDWSGVLIPANS